MKQLEGKSVNAGIAMARMKVLRKKDTLIQKRIVDEPGIEEQRFLAAQKKAILELETLREREFRENESPGAAVLDAYGLILQDMRFTEVVRKQITNESVNAEYAVFCAGEQFIRLFLQMDNPYLQSRAADIRDIMKLLLLAFKEEAEEVPALEGAVILAADELAAHELMSYDLSKVSGIVTRYGTANSHAAILAGMRDIPMVTDIEFDSEDDGREAVLDGTRGVLIVSPDKDTVRSFHRYDILEARKKEAYCCMKHIPTVTKGGRQIALMANIGEESDIVLSLENDAEGIGLFRSEFLFLGRECAPSEEEQFRVYKKALLKLRGKRIIIRTFDLGGDKNVSYLNLKNESNPSLGCRGIRIYREYEDLIKTQLRALLRASIYGNVSVLYPMITTMEELNRIQMLYNQVCRELREEGIVFSESVQQGVMVETPAAAMISDLLAEKADFLSIGTNDLIQYTLVLDRQNSQLNYLHDLQHPALHRLMQMIIDNGHKAGKRVGVCGEAASDPAMLRQLIGMGVDEISVSPSGILPVRKLICEID